MKFIPSRLAEARKLNGLKQSELAKELGLTYRSVQNWEYGHNEPSGENLTALSRILGKETGYFYTEEAQVDAQRSPVDGLADEEAALPIILALFREQQAMVDRQRQDTNKLLAEQQGLMERQRQDTASLLAEQQGMLERQRQDTAHLTLMLERQQEHFIAQQQWQQRQSASQADKQQSMIEALVKKVESLESQLLAQAQHRPPRGRQQLFDSPANPGLAGER